MNILIQVALGGAIGAVLRFASVQWIARALGLGAPTGVMLVNIVGSFLMGVVAVWMFERSNLGHYAPLLMTGVLGGFTTFSAFSLDAIALWEQGRQMISVAYVLGSVVLAITALLVGMMFMRSILT